MRDDHPCSGCGAWIYVSSNPLLIEYNAKQAGAPDGLPLQIAELQARLDTVLENRDRSRAIEDRIAAVAAARGTALERVVAAYDDLEKVVDELLPPHADAAELAPLVAKLALVKQRRPGT